MRLLQGVKTNDKNIRARISQTIDYLQSKHINYRFLLFPLKRWIDSQFTHIQSQDFSRMIGIYFTYLMYTLLSYFIKIVLLILLNISKHWIDMQGLHIEFHYTENLQYIRSE